MVFAQVVLHTQDPEYASDFLFYKWGEPPPQPLSPLCTLWQDT